jgi:hypothetical protein
MPDSTGRHIDDRIDRYVRGELTAAEARELAQASLDDSELFDHLTYSALAKSALSTESAGEQIELPGSAAKVIRFPRRTRVLIAGASAAAAIILISFSSLRSSYFRQNRPELAKSQSHETVPAFPITPALASSAKPGQPVLLATDLEPGPARRNGAPVFRSPEQDSRSPQPTGSIVAIEDGMATINLGSVDGLAKGSELQISRNQRTVEAAGRFVVSTVFRERARGLILAGQAIEVNDQVRAPAAIYLGAVLQRVEALSGQGDSNAARTIAEKAAGWAQSAKVPPGETRKVWERLAALEYQAGSLQAAAHHYQSVIDSFDAAPPVSARDRSVALNNVAVLHLLLGAYGGAEAQLSQAVSMSPKTDTVYGRSLNNLGVIAELRGDRPKAEAFFTDALRALAAIANSPEQDRRVVEANLARLRSSH